MTGLTSEQILATPPGDLANQSSESLFQLKAQATGWLATAKEVDAWVDKALDLKYSQRARELRLAEGKDTGVVHFEDGPVHISADLPKKVDWDQARLADIARRIADGGEDPGQYIAISYPWREICKRFDCDRTTAWRRWQVAMGVIVDHLNAVAEGKTANRREGVS